MEAAQPAPLLLIADDAHWLDRPTCDVLAFIARRVHFEPVVLVLAVREGIDNPFEAARLPDLVIGPLDDASAGALPDAHAPGRSPAIRGPLFQAAAGNPLTLVELPVALGPDWFTRQGLYGGRMPLTARLERAFAARVRGLPCRPETPAGSPLRTTPVAWPRRFTRQHWPGGSRRSWGSLPRGICAAGGSGRYDDHVSSLAGVVGARADPPCRIRPTFHYHAYTECSDCHQGRHHPGWQDWGHQLPAIAVSLPSYPERHRVRNAASKGRRTWPHSRRLTGLPGACA